MSVLFINAAFREDSRTLHLAEKYLMECKDEITRLELGDEIVSPLDRTTLRIYNEAVATHSFDNNMFKYAKQFAVADKIVIAAPFWNYSIPAVLHSYLELVCTQGISFDIDETGHYGSLCKANKLVYITTAGGPIPEKDHAFGYIEDLCRFFWNIQNIEYYKADGLDIYGTDVNAKLEGVRFKN